MSARRTWNLLRRDLQVGPRSPIFLYAFVFPVVATLLVRVVFGSLFDPTPRLGVVDQGGSQIAVVVAGLEGIETARLDSEADLRRQVEANDLDGGLLLPAGFDEAVRTGEQPDLQLFVGGESLASNRLILAVTTIDLIRDLAGSPAPVEVELVTIGDANAIPVASRLLPCLVMMVVMIAGVFLPASGLVEEREKKTLDALLVTPVQMPEVLVSKGLLGVGLALVMGKLTLALNDALGANPAGLVLIMAVGALMGAETGLIMGSWARDTNTLAAAIKGLGFVLLAPVAFFIWTDLPQWIAYIFPTHYFMKPLYEVAVKGADLASVLPLLGIALAICLALLPLIFGSGRRMQAGLASA
ncbi:MAG: ABC transporter permease [Chloroflexota bacterium]|nr:ABC transporter permease [Chloroflexota bacterium]